MTEKRKLADVDQEVRDIARILPQLAERIRRLEEAADTRRPEVNVCLSLDLWPPSQWLKLSFSPWEPGKYLQTCVGPVRLDVFE